MRRSLRQAAPAAAVVLLALATSGCGDARAEPPRIVEELPCAELSPEAGWESMPWRSECDWLPYPGKTTLEVHHGLGRRPLSVLVYIAFEPDGDNGTIGSGDVVRIREVTAEQVTVRNATKQDFFMRLVVQ